MKSIGVVLRQAFGYDADAASLQAGLECKDKSLAQQSQAKEADINEIVKRFGLTGQLPSNLRVPLQEDFIEAMSYHEALEAMRAAQAAFMQLPAAVRSEFQNDAGRFVEFCSAVVPDPQTGELVLANRARMKDLGLLVPEPDAPSTAAVSSQEPAKPAGA